MYTNLQNRKYIVIGAMAIIMFILLCRLFYLQLIESSYKDAADNNALRNITEHPDRGLIFDRNDSLMVYNEAAYDLMVVPNELREFDTLDLCRTLDIDKETLIKRIEKAKNYSPMIPSIFEQQMSKEACGSLQEKLFKFPGFFVQNRTLRSYPAPIAAHILGYIGEVNSTTIEEDPYYQMGDYIGISGIEKAYEEELRGVKGRRVVLVDVHNREKGSFKNGKEDVKAQPGKDLWCTLDMDLQKYGEQLMEGKKGSIVAIEPSTGEILCIVSSPSYDPNLLVGKDRSKNYVKLMRDSVKVPLFNRALMASYPPGSTFKLANGLIALQEGIINTSTSYYCGGGYNIGNHVIGCHHGGATNIVAAVQHSCNTFFCRAFYNIVSNKKKYKTIQEGYSAWRHYINSLGFGQKFDTDLPYELKGTIPTADYFDRKYSGHWNGNSIVSMGIGQGEAGTTPLQMANLLCIIANRGYYVKPHIVKAIGSKDNPNDQFSEKIKCDIEPKYFIPIIKGMELVMTQGTARSSNVPGLKIAGKTGTAQNPHGRDHSVFACFAPSDKPQIAVFVLVENGGWGGVVAAPIATLMLEHYLKGETSRPDVEKNILTMKFY
ncbi:MAG: penicillin-binding protein 2 [Bacteroidales bacterium]|nr:penicillin-binding protein 2 [Bacteroidales bacterium]